MPLSNKLLSAIDSPPAASTGTRSLSFIGNIRPVSSTSSSYRFFTCAFPSSSFTLQPEHCWYILAVSSRDANGFAGDNYGIPDFVGEVDTNNYAIDKFGKTLWGAYSIPYSSIVLYAFKTSEVGFSITVPLTSRHEGGAVAYLFEYDYTGSTVWHGSTSRTFFHPTYNGPWGQDYVGTIASVVQNNTPVIAPRTSLTYNSPGSYSSTLYANAFNGSTSSTLSSYLLYLIGTSNTLPGSISALDTYAGSPPISNANPVPNNGVIEHGTYEWTKCGFAPISSSQATTDPSINIYQVQNNRGNQWIVSTFGAE